MSTPIHTDQTSIQGPCGKLQILLETSKSPNPAQWVSIICHPHPQHEGSMNNKVVTTLSRAFLETGAHSVRFNYRGVGESEGSYGHFSGELEDSLAVLDWVNTKFPNHPIAICGFSFGASIALKIAKQRKINLLMTIAPALYLIDYDKEIIPNAPWLLIQGWEDEVVNIKETLDWCNTLEKKPELCCLPEVSHFFHGKLIELRKKLIQYIQGVNNAIGI